MALSCVVDAGVELALAGKPAGVGSVLRFDPLRYTHHVCARYDTLLAATLRAVCS